MKKKLTWRHHSEWCFISTRVKEFIIWMDFIGIAELLMMTLTDV